MTLSLYLSFDSLHSFHLHRYSLALVLAPNHSIEPEELLIMTGIDVVQLEKHLLTYFAAEKDQNSNYSAVDSSCGCIGDQVSFQEK